MPRKPTEPYGYIAFGKDGSVKKHDKKLLEEKTAQEQEVAKKFAKGLNNLDGSNFISSLCEENDHDFWLTSRDYKVQVQATEIVSRDYLKELSQKDYLTGNHNYSNILLKAHNQVFGINVDSKENVLLERVIAKISKNYAKQETELWLLVWTVCPDYLPFWNQAGERCVSVGVNETRKHLLKNGAGPFNEIWFLNLVSSPKRIWPVEV